MSYIYNYRVIRKKSYPTIPVVLKHGGNSMAVTAVLDSGSTDIYLPKEIAEILGLKLEKAIQGFGIEGPVMVHPSIVSISIGKGAVEKTATLPCFVSGTDHFVDILFEHTKVY